MNSSVGMLQINLPHTWDTFEGVYKDCDIQSDGRVSKDESV